MLINGDRETQRLDIWASDSTRHVSLAALQKGKSKKRGARLNEVI